MPRNRSLSNTLIPEFKKAIKVGLPFFDSWLHTIKPVQSDQLITTQDLFELYSTFVNVKTQRQKILKLVNFRSFARRFATFAAKQNLKAIAFPKRGYFAAIDKKYPRKIPNVQPLKEKALSCAQRPEQERASSVEIKFISKEKGYGLFASSDIESNEIICEYIGQFLTSDEALERDRFYKSQKMVPKIIYFDGNKKAIDGYCNKQGIALGENENLGSIINHSKLHPNS